MKPHCFHRDAEAEYVEAARYYSKVDSKLGLAFFEEVEGVISEIRRFPQAAVRVDGDLRRRLLSRFPFGILYYIQPDRIWIVAVMHLRRHPSYWKTRI